MRIHIYHLLEGARRASGLTVIIDVFRAFSLECYLYHMGAAEIRPVGSVEDTFAWREKDPACVLIGERGGAKIEGMDFGNSPSQVSPAAVRGKRVIHTTSAGTQGIINAANADEILTGSLVNADAIAEYIRQKDPAEVSLVCMGKAGIEIAEEDELCAEYIRLKLLGLPVDDVKRQITELQFRGGKHFFRPDTQEIFPEADFYLCICTGVFPFVLRVTKDELGYLSEKVGIDENVL